MLNDLIVGRSDPATVADVLKRWTAEREDNEGLYDADPALAAAYRDFRAFLVGSRSDITPALRDLKIPALPIDPSAAPELAIAMVITHAMFEVAKHNAISRWTRELDQKCRTSYRRIMPLMLAAARGERGAECPVHIRHWFTPQNWVYLEALNSSGRELTNVTLHARFATIDGRSSDHFYYFPAWPKESANSEAHRRYLRPAADWWSIGAAATTAVTVTLISDEVVTSGTRFALPDHIPSAADLVFDEVEVMLKRKQLPKEAMRRLERTKPHLGAYPDRLRRLEDLHGRADEMLRAIVADLDKKIAASRKQIESLEKPQQRASAESRRVSQLQKARETLRRLEIERAAWLGGKR